jgi:hypothetical protein
MLMTPPAAAGPRVPCWVWLPPVLGILAYLDAIPSGFVWDDRHLIVENPMLRQPSPLPWLVSDFWQDGRHTDMYRPLVSLSYFLEFRLWKLWPAGYHAANVVLHGLATFTVAGAARLLLGQALAATIAGAVFALHPIHTESVAFISGRTDVLAAAFVVGSFALFLRRRRGDGGASAGSLVLFAAALLCKETAIALPPLLAVWELTLASGDRRPGSGSVRGLAARLGPYVAVTAGYLGLRWIVLGSPTGRAIDPTGLGARAVIALNALGDYLRLLVFAHPAAPDRAPDRQFSVHTVLTIVVVALLATVLVRIRCRTRLPVFLGAWFVLTLLPASPLIPGRPPLVAERFLYVPSAAFAWLAGWAGANLWSILRSRRRAVAGAVIAAGAAAGLGVGLLTALRNLDWRDEYQLFSRMAASEPRSYLAPLNLGYLYLDAGDLAPAESEFRRALGLRPASAPALVGLGLVASRRGEHDLAIGYAERARALQPEAALVHAQLGAIYGVAGRYPDAVGSFRESIRRNPRRMDARANLVVALADEGRLGEAAAALVDAERVLTAQSYQDPLDVQRLARLRQQFGAGEPRR